MEVNPIQYLIVGLLILSLILSGISIALHLTKNDYVTEEDLKEEINEIKSSIPIQKIEKLNITHNKASNFISTEKPLNKSIE